MQTHGSFGKLMGEFGQNGDPLRLHLTETPEDPFCS